MHGHKIATLLVVATLGLARPTLGLSSDATDEARQCLARNEATKAIGLLEGVLLKADPTREGVMDLLQKAYEMAATQAQAAGRTREAEIYREDLKILNRRSKTSVKPAVEPEPLSSPSPARLPEQPTPRIPDAVEPDPVIESAAESPRIAPPAIVPAESEPQVEPTKPLPMPVDTPAPASILDLSAGDFAFQAKNYAEAGRIYGELARNKRLPSERLEHWAYSRSAVIVDRINAHPRTEAEWAEIDAEIAQIRAIKPNNWVAEYLRNRASERLAGRKQTMKGKTVVRASSPEEPAAIDRPVRPASIPSSATAASNTKPVASRSVPTMGRWQTRETENFRIYHSDPALAERVAQAAESARLEQTKHWTNALAINPWLPLCEVYLYPSAKLYAQATGQPEDSPGFSTMGMNSGRIISRRISLRADHPSMVRAVLPHEITHVILADIFPSEQIPRWADEGLAVLSEPRTEQDRRAADLIQPLAENRLFAVDTLMGMDYPDERYWALYYAQSVSLTRFLVELGTPAQMIQFLQGSQKNGFEAELRKVYAIDGYAELQRRWLVFARNQESARTATLESPDSAEVTPDLQVR
ncbi:peptidase MA family metallohydrolase [Tundrisphaera lichenicola]|uniref:peptidase MA family metallohydrolase n=1 Tax=Tundrisphaera lichenicola TaxID=2029860 RepID=UPI003EC11D87